MKKETAILVIVIAFLVGFITGATVAILKGKKGAEKVAAVQKPKGLPRWLQCLLLKAPLLPKLPQRSKP